MNKHNKTKFQKALKADMAKSNISQPTFKQTFVIIINISFKTRRGCLYLSCLEKGMSMPSAYKHAFKQPMDKVVNALVDHDWDISFGKLS